MLVVKLTAPGARRLGGQLLLAAVIFALATGLLVLAAASLAASSEGPWVFRSGAWVSSDEAAVTRSFGAAPGVRVGWVPAGPVVLYRDRIERPPTDAWLLDLVVLPEREVVAVGERGVVVRRARSGEWTALASGGPTLRAVALSPSGVVYAAGDQGVLLRIEAEEVEPLQSGPGPRITALRVLPDGRVAGRSPSSDGWGWLGWVVLTATAVVLLGAGRSLVRGLSAWRAARWARQRLGPAHARLVPTAGAVRVLFAARRLADTGAGEVTLRLRVLNHRVEARIERAHAKATVAIPPGGAGPLHLEAELPIELPDDEGMMVTLTACLAFDGAAVTLTGETRPSG